MTENKIRNQSAEPAGNARPSDFINRDEVVRLPEAVAEGCEKLLTKRDVATICQVTTRTVDAWMQNGSLVFYKISRTIRFRLSDLHAHWNTHCRVARRKLIN